MSEHILLLDAGYALPPCIKPDNPVSITSPLKTYTPEQSSLIMSFINSPEFHGMSLKLSGAIQ